MNKSFYRELEKHLLKKCEILKNAIKSAKKARDGAPSAMESASDTTRSEKEDLIRALEQDLHQFEKVIESIPATLLPHQGAQMWDIVEAEIGGKKQKVCLVPESIGGEVVESIRLLSVTSPLGKTLLG